MHSTLFTALEAPGPVSFDRAGIDRTYVSDPPLGAG